MWFTRRAALSAASVISIVGCNAFASPAVADQKAAQAAGGRRTATTGPIITAPQGSQAQDAFPTEIDPTFPPGSGERFRPTTDIFGTAAFSRSFDLGVAGSPSPNLIVGDSITVTVQDQSGAGIVAVEWYGMILFGVHRDKSPPPWTIGPNNFFMVSADSVRDSSGQVVPNEWYVDLDDDYFRGGDRLHYFWLARDGAGGVSSMPPGLTSVPTSLAEAEQATEGLFEVSFLPTINWSTAYRNRVVADPHGKLDPTPDEIAQSYQRNCILYVQQLDPRRRAIGFAGSTAFGYNTAMMLSLNVGELLAYDVYDHEGLGGMNNHLGGRATSEQAGGYNMIIYDAGNRPPDGEIVPDGSVLDGQKVDQAGWFRSWLDAAATSPAGYAVLWIIGTDVVEERPTHPLYSVDAGVSLVTPDQNMNPNPHVEAQTSMTFDVGSGSDTIDFTMGQRRLFSLEGGAPNFRDYDGLAATGTAVELYRYKDWFTDVLGPGAMIANSNPAKNWNTIIQSHAWDDIRTVGYPYPPASFDLERSIRSLVPYDCLCFECYVDTPPQAITTTRLMPNVPNPFNPVTTIHFDLARGGHVSLHIYDVAGRRVRTLLDRPMDQNHHAIVWDGLDDQGHRIASGLYFYRLTTAGYTAARKMVALQ